MKGVITHGTGEVAVGAGSVWVGHGGFNPGAWVERLDPETGRVQHRFSILGGDVDHLAFGDGALWVASTPSGELRKIDPRTNKVVFTRKLRPQLCCVAAGGGYVWAATNPKALSGRSPRTGASCRHRQAPGADPERHLRRTARSGRARRGAGRSCGSTRRRTSSASTTSATP